MTDIQRLIAKQVYYMNCAHQLMTDVKDLRAASEPHLDTLYWSVFQDDAPNEMSYLKMMQSNLFVEGIMVRRALRFQRKANRLDEKIGRLGALAGAGLVNLDISTLNETRDEVILSSARAAHEGKGYMYDGIYQPGDFPSYYPHAEAMRRHLAPYDETIIAANKAAIDDELNNPDYRIDKKDEN